MQSPSSLARSSAICLAFCGIMWWELQVERLVCSTSVRSSVRLLTLLSVLLVVPLVGVGLLPALDAGPLRSVLSSLVQVLGVLLGATVVTYVFWTNGTRAQFEDYTRRVLGRVGEVATSMGDPTRIRYRSAIVLAGAGVERDLSEPYQPKGLTLLLPDRPGDKWRSFYEGYQDLEAKVFRKAYLYVLATLIALVLLLTLLALGIGAAERIALEAPWLSKLALIAFGSCLAWFAVLMTLLLRPGAGIIISVEKREADGTI